MAVKDLSHLCKHYGVGLTGGIATGKSTVAQYLRNQGLLVCDADDFARTAAAPGGAGYKEILRTFGCAVQAEDGSLDRSKLRACVMNSPDSKAVLEGILHPRIQDLLFDHLCRDGLTTSPRLWFYEASLLFETSCDQQFRSIWCTYCDADLQRSRLTTRLAGDRALADLFIASQMDPLEKSKRAKYVIDTGGSLQWTKSQVDRLLQLEKQELSAWLGHTK